MPLLDIARWGLGVDTHPRFVAASGGKFFFDDDQQFPDTQYAVCEYAPAAGGKAKRLIFEQRIWSPYVQEGYENGAAFYGTKGMLVIGHNVGWKLCGERNRLLAERTGPADLRAHHDGFLQCVRGESSAPAASAVATNPVAASGFATQEPRRQSRISVLIAMTGFGDLDHPAMLDVIAPAGATVMLIGTRSAGNASERFNPRSRTCTGRAGRRRSPRPSRKPKARQSTTSAR